MNREELEHVIEAACANLDEGQVIVFGSQSILGTYDETELPEYATLSREVDVFPRSGIDAPASPAVVEKILILNGRLGECSPFHESFGVYVEGIHKGCSGTAEAMGQPLVAVEVQDGSEYGRAGFCLDPVDLCASKAIAGREKDRVFVAALVEDGIVTATQILGGIDSYGIEWPDTYPVPRPQPWGDERGCSDQRGLRHCRAGPDGSRCSR
ncbi:hypothetical protein ACH47B_32410 [Rhodococcus sp. NPDC019627]|uniref:Uncharacterized protein n=1 Tax=Rhodococcus opacus (strain B4) TaxID=632772 RepID=C1BDI0_RHOOB|nr:hypothetical protein [Rhodococcus opacus]BAH47033.1 hypothetical protein ROP_pROB02-00200 [Rhodococcus opacus B4]